jgi:HAD superfamily hydrolase (TIGR01549 family)
MTITWFLFDLGNTLIKLAYERVLENICRSATVSRDELVNLLESPGAYRDLERGAVSFPEFYEFLCDKTGYRGSVRDLQDVWGDFFDGTITGMEIHAEQIPRQFAGLFRKDDRFIFSHRFKVAKPDPEMFRRALDVIGALPPHVVFIDDLAENVNAARALGMHAFQFIDAVTLTRELEAEKLL